MSGLAGRVAAVALLLSGCASVPGGLEPLDVTLADLVPAQMGLMEQEYAVKIRVQNPNKVDVPLAGLSYQIELNGKPFAKGVARADTTVPGFGDVVLDGKAVSTLIGILDQVAAVSKAAPGKFSYRLKGKLVPREGASIPFDQKGEVALAGLMGEEK
jgi:LEA14-like dessication related protein